MSGKRKRQARKRRAAAKRRAQAVEKRCSLCGEERHLRRVEVRVDGKRAFDWRLCRSDCAGLLVLLGDPRNHRRR